MLPLPLEELLCLPHPDPSGSIMHYNNLPKLSKEEKIYLYCTPLELKK
jgi:hypothetical protein